MRKKVNILWLKKDIRLQDHACFKACSESKYQTIVVFIFEPEVENNYDFAYRHWQFIYQSLKEMQQKIPVNLFYGNTKIVFEQLLKSYDIQSIFSHQETGNLTTFERDIEIKQFLKFHGIIWKEFVTNGVIRGKRIEMVGIKIG